MCIRDRLKGVLMAIVFSNNTVYAWYSAIQPFSWWQQKHVKGGKGELNFDTYLAKKKKHKLDEIIKVSKMMKCRWHPIRLFIERLHYPMQIRTRLLCGQNNFKPA